MTDTLIHLALSHVPVLFMPLALVLLLVGMIKNRPDLNKAALAIFLVSALAAIPVLRSGEGAEKIIENKPDVLHESIEAHEDAAEFAFKLALATGVMALLSLVVLAKKPRFKKASFAVTTVVATLSSASLLRAAYLGGHIRHTELIHGAQNSQPLEEFDPEFLKEIEKTKEREENAGDEE